MSETAKKYPKEVRGIYIAGKAGEEGREVEMDRPEGGDPNVSRAHRDWDREVRAMALAAGKFFNTYLELHQASNEETRDGAVKHFAKNALKAQKAAVKTLQNNSKVFDQNPSRIYDNMVEYMEDLEDEYAPDKE